MAQFMLVVVLLMGSYHLTVSWFVFFSGGLSQPRSLTLTLRQTNKTQKKNQSRHYYAQKGKCHEPRN
uniref:Putative secreted protein n=1 Tax=Anopheles darlingi TaxID=43151 RepID=A0A2M4DK56_ANODA